MAVSVALEQNLAENIVKVSGSPSIKDAVTKVLQDYLKAQAAARLMEELNSGLRSGDERGWYSASEVEAALGIEK